MTSVRTYAVVYVLLLLLATSKYVAFELGLSYWTMVGAILVAAFLKSTLIVGYFQHLKDEPRAVTYLVLSSLFAVFLLSIAASYSIHGGAFT